MLTLCCVNVGNYRGKGDMYVSRLRSMAQRHLSIPHDFVCITESNERGWWAKLELARWWFPDWVLYLDLDVILTANIDAVVKHAMQDENLLWMRDDFSYSMRNPKKGLDSYALRMLGGDGCCNSSVMLWKGNTLRPVWDAWLDRRAEVLNTMHGDQNFISQVMRERIGFLPDELIQSYKYGIMLKGEKPAPIVVCHGNDCKPDLLRDDWVKKHWRDE